MNPKLPRRQLQEEVAAMTVVKFSLLKSRIDLLLLLGFARLFSRALHRRLVKVTWIILSVSYEAYAISRTF